MAQEINEKLTHIGIAQLSGREQMQLADVLDCAGAVESQRRSLDANGARFVLFFRQHALRTGRKRDVAMSWREINWAFHSTSQDILVNFVARQSHGTILWQNARDSGMFMWLADQSALVRSFLGDSAGVVSSFVLLTILSELNLRTLLVTNTHATTPRILYRVACSTLRCARRPSCRVYGVWPAGTGNK
jgi:hypothetical protein